MIFNSPIYLTIPRKTKADKKIPLNLNWYRNAHFRLSNEVKHIYCDIMKDQLEGVKLKTPIQVIFKLKKKGKRLVDKNNVYSIVAKFFYDALTHYGCIEDDSDKYIGFESYFPTVYNGMDDECIIEVIEN